MARVELLMTIILSTMFTAAPLGFSYQRGPVYPSTHMIHPCLAGNGIGLENYVGYHRDSLQSVPVVLGGSVGGGFFVAVSRTWFRHQIILCHVKLHSDGNRRSNNILESQKTNYIHPTFQPLINYNLVLLIHPMLLLGVGIGVTFIVILAEWMLTLLLFIIFLGTKQYPQSLEKLY